MTQRARLVAALAALLLAAVPARPAAQDAAGGAPPAKARPALTIPRLDAKPRVDGVLDEPAWQQAALLDGFHQFQPVDARPAEERTEARVFYTPSAICFGARAYDSQPASIHATVADRDSLVADDTITIYLDTFNDRRRAFFFTVNPLGVQEDGVRTEGITNASGLADSAVDRNPDFLFESGGRLLADGYAVELCIPFKSLRYPRGPDTQAWGLNVERRVRRTGYVDTWTDVRQGQASFLTQSGVIRGLRDLHGGPVIEVQPFLTASADGRRDFDTGSFAREPVDPDGGLNLRVGLAPDVSLDATWNPDFSQVESDVGQVTINERFPLFYPEKRPFFLEGIDLFSTPNRLVYTRQVVDPIFGTKLTLKRGALNLAHLMAVDEDPSPAVPNAFLGATRLRRDLGHDSTAGLLATHRRQGDRRNTVLAGDARWVFGKLYFVQAQAGASWTQAEPGRPAAAAPLWLAEFDRTGRKWGFNYKVNAVGDGFLAEAGYIPRSDVVEATTSNRVSFYGARGSLAESLALYHGFTGLWTYRGFDASEPAEERNTVLALLRLRGGWQVWAQPSLKSFRFDPDRYAGYATATGAGLQPFTPPPSADGLWDFLGRVDLPTFRALDGYAQVLVGSTPIHEEAARGHEQRWSAVVNLRPTGSLRAAASLVFAKLSRARDGSEFARTLLPRLTLEYQPRRPLFFRLVAEYRSERTAPLRDPRTGEPLLVDGAPPAPVRTNSLRVNALISYEPRPGTLAFAGYGASLDNPRRSGFSDLSRTRDGFFVKLAYRFQR